MAGVRGGLGIKMSDTVIVEEVIEDLQRIQSFEVESLVQRERLGEMAFVEAVAPARRLVALFNRMPTEALKELPAQQLKLIQQKAKATYSYFDNILNFNLKTGDPETQKQQLVDQISASYQDTFTSIYPLISYSVARTVDFASLESNGRAAIQAINDDKENVLSEIRKTSEEAASVLDEVRNAAAEQGVTQQAKYFADEAVKHEEAARKWLAASVVMAFVVLAYAVLTFFIPSFVNPRTNSEIAQMIASKVLVFGVLAYALFQSVRNYSAHRHNAVTNKHRQNALMTYTTLAEAGRSSEARDAVLHHAAAAIYTPNDSGYLRHSEDNNHQSPPLITVSPRSLLNSGMSEN